MLRRKMMLVLVIRTLILYFIVILSVRIMGKRQIGEMQPSELVVAIMISDLASVPMQAIDIPLISGVVPVLTLIVGEVIIAFISLKSKTMRRIISGEPNVIISGGHVNEGELRRQRFNLNDLLEQLRINGYPNIADVETAVLETNGQLSVIPKREARPATVKDLKIKDAAKESLPFMLISDGVLNRCELKRSGKSEKWLKSQIKCSGAESYDEVFIASLDINDGFYFQRKGESDIK